MKNYRTIDIDKWQFETTGVHTGIMRIDLSKWGYEPRGDYELCLKVFRDDYKPLEEFMWKHTNLMDATIIQNILHEEGFAPRVYDLVKVMTPVGIHWGQIVEYLPDSERGAFSSKEKGEEIKRVMKKNGIGIVSIDPNPKHKYVDKMVDMSQLYLVDDIYKNDLIERFTKDAIWGSNPKPYQGIKELGIEGQRTLGQRLIAYDFDSVDFRGKTVIDFGCSGGELSREAVDRGAKYCVGIDLPRVANVTREMNRLLGYFNIDVIGGDFSCKKEIPDVGHYDIAFYMSTQQLGFPEYLKDRVDILYLEGHSGDHRETYEDRLKKMFNKVEFLGGSNDHSVRPVFRASNGT